MSRYPDMLKCLVVVSDMESHKDIQTLKKKDVPGYAHVIHVPVEIYEKADILDGCEKLYIIVASHIETYGQKKYGGCEFTIVVSIYGKDRDWMITHIKDNYKDATTDISLGTLIKCKVIFRVATERISKFRDTSY